MMAIANEDVNLNLSLARDKHQVSIKVHSRVSIDTTVRRPMAGENATHDQIRSMIQLR